MPFFTIISVGPGNQLVASFGYLQFCVLALAQPSVHVMNMHVSFGRGARHPSLHSHCQYTSCEGSCHQQVAQELCTTLRQRESSFNVAEDAMKQALASALIETQRKVVSNPPAFPRSIKSARVLRGRQTARPMAVCLTVTLVQVPQAELQAQKSAAPPCWAQAHQCQLEAWALQTSWT